MATFKEPSSADHCYAKLIEMFGESLEMESICQVGRSCQWNCKYRNVMSTRLPVPVCALIMANDCSCFATVAQCVEALLLGPESAERGKTEPSSSSSSVHQDTAAQSDASAAMSYSQRFQLGLSATNAFTEAVARERPDKNAHLDKLYYQIADGYKIVVLMRGLPGSGKSSLARQLLQKASLDPAQHIVSADDYFTDRRCGTYHYDRSRLAEAHADCQARAKALMVRHFAPIVVDNTNVRLWEMEPYCVLAVDHGYIVQILEPTTAWAKSPEECHRRNSHGVPFDTVLKMRRTYERIQNGQELLDHFHLPKRITFQFRELPAIAASPEVQPEPDVIQSFSPIASTDDVVIDSEEIVRPSPFENFNWPAHEREVSLFWQEHILPQQASSSSGQTHSIPTPRPQARPATGEGAPTNQSLFDQMLSALKDDAAEADPVASRATHAATEVAAQVRE